MTCDRLESLDWDYKNGEYVLQLSSGKAVIKESKKKVGFNYRPEIRGADDEVLSSFPHGMEFESAEAFIRANLIELDKKGVNEAEFMEKLASTLDMCRDLFSENEHYYHRIRLENIKRWLRESYYAESDKPERKNDWESFTFDWQYQNDVYTAETVHGLAIIEETAPERSSFSLANTSSYKVTIKHPTGIELGEFYVLSLQFEEAENRVRRLLADLEHPFVDETLVHTITFTLRICQCLLPETTDLMHFVCLQYIDNYLGEVLP